MAQECHGSGMGVTWEWLGSGVVVARYGCNSGAGVSWKWAWE